MLSAWRFYFALLSCGLLAAIGALTVTAPGAPAAPAAASAGPPPSSALFDSLSVPGVQMLDGAQQQAGQLLVDRTDPAAVFARWRSRTQYERLSAAAAARAIRVAVPGVVAKSLTGVNSLPSGARVSRYLNARAAQLSLPGGRHAVVETLTPMATPTPSGGFAAVNLGLRETSGGFLARNAPAPVNIPKSLAKGLTVGTSGVSLTPVSRSGAPLRGLGRLDGSAVVYPNTATDADTAAKPTSSGLETYAVLRSLRSPQTLAYRIGLPKGASLATGKKGTGELRIVAGGHTVAEILPSTAVDAAGTPVPVVTKLSGRTLTLTVAHRSGDYRYPIVVDPTVVDSHFESWGETNWRFESEPCCLKGSFSNYEESDTWHIEVHPSYVANEWGALIYPTQGESHIYEMTMETSSGFNAGLESHLAIFNGEFEISNVGGWEGNVALAASHAKSPATVCAGSCSSSGGTASNVAAYWINAIENGAGSEDMFAQAYTASVYIAQNNGPSASFDTTKEHVHSGRKNVLSTSGGWISESGGAAEVDLSDPGIGVREVQYTAGGVKWTKQAFCSGLQCPESTTQEIDYKNGSTSLPDGEPTVEAKVFNSMGSSYTTSAKVKVDGTAPHEIAVSGLPSEVSDSTRNLKVIAKATDGVTGTPSSGVAYFKLAVDGKEVGSANGSCSPGPCTATGEWSLNGEDYSAGKHTYTVTATDVAGNSASIESTFIVHHAAPVQLGPGTLNPVTGEFDLEETDVSIQTTGTPLTVTRSYDSREPAAGGEGALGAPWSLSFGGAQSLIRYPSKNVTLVSATGAQTTYFYKEGGKYEAPAGDKNLVLTANAGETEYTLTDQGATTVFTHVSGDAEGVYQAAFESGIAGIGKTQYTYQVVEGRLVPYQELGPVPAGVSCTPSLKPGCRELTFEYATSTTAVAGELPRYWGDYAGRLKQVSFSTVEENSKGEQAPVTIAVARYEYDVQGYLRSEFDPRASQPETWYGYDGDGRLTAIDPPGREPLILLYGTSAGDTSSGRLVKMMRPPATEALWEGYVPGDKVQPTLTGSAVVGNRMTTSDGEWLYKPLAFSYQWEDCNASGEECKPIGGATNANYTPTASDVGHTLVATVTATNGGGSKQGTTTPSAVVQGAEEAVEQVVEQKLSAPFGCPRSIAKGPDGNLWFTDCEHQVGKITKAGATTAYNFPAGVCLGAIATGPDGNLWVTEECANRIAKVTTGGTITEYNLPSGSKPMGIVAGPDGNLWFVDSGTSKVGKITTSGTVTEYALPSGSAPLGIAAGSDGTLWFSENGTSKVGKITTSGTVTEYALPSGSSPRGVALGPDGWVWFADGGTDKLGKINTTGTIAEYALPSGSKPVSVTAGTDGNVWFADTGAGYSNKIGEITVGGGRIREYTLATGAAPYSLAQDPEGDHMWFTEEGVNAIGKIATEHVAEYQMSTPIWRPYYITKGPDGNMWFTDNGHHQVGEITPGGTATSYNLPANVCPGEITAGSDGNLWATEECADKIAKVTTGGAITEYSLPSGSTPSGVAAGPDGNLWFTDYGSSKIGKITTSGTVSEYALPAGSHPLGIAAGPDGNLWFTENATDKIGKITTSGAITEYSLPSGSGPHDITAGPDGDLWFTDYTSSKVGKITTGGTVTEYELHSGSGPVGIAAGGDGNMWIVESEHGDKLVRVSTAGTIREYSLGGAVATSIATGPESNRLWFTISEFDIIGSVTMPITEGEARGAQPGTTIEYEVPVSGSAAPYAMGGSEVSKWAQSDTPTEGTAIFPPEEKQGWPASDYRNATVDYFDPADRLVNVASPGGGITTSEYNSYGDVVRNLSADDREAALKEGAKSAEVSQLLDTQNSYGEEGTEVLSTLGPRHTVKLANGSSVQARKHTVYSYDEGAPGSGGPYRLVTKVTEGAQIAGEPEADVRTTTKSYAGQSNLGWILHKPTATKVDPSGLKLVSSVVYDPTSGNVTETRTPGAGAPNEEIATGYTYKSSFAGGYVSKPGAIARDPEGNIWIADTGDNLVKEFSSGGTFIREFGSGWLKKPEGITVDGEGHVWVADTGDNRVQEFTTTGEHVGYYGSQSGLIGPTGITYIGSGNSERLYVLDPGQNNVDMFSSGGADLGRFASKGSGNGQVSKPEGIAADSEKHIWIADTGNNRVEEFGETGSYISQFGSLGSGNGQLNKPEGLAADSEGNVLVADGGNNRIEEFSSSGTYKFQFGTAGTGEKQMKTPADLALDSSNDAFVLDTGNNRVQKWVPSVSLHESSGNGGTHGVQTIYYTAGANAEVSGCGNKPEWAGLPCEKRLAAQPETSGLPNLPVTTTTYNVWEEPLVSTETVGTSTRTNTNVYDEAGRLTKDTVSSSVGTALPSVEYEYNWETGGLKKSSTTVEGVTRSIEPTYDKRGELTSYKDADGNTSSFYYDPYGRLESMNDGKGTQTYTYDATTGQVTKLVDSAAGTFTASYDAEGNLTTVGYPNGMNVNHAYDSTGSETGIEYVKTTYCSTGCVWYSQSESSSIHGQTLSQSSTLSSQTYTYDAAGRLTKAQDTPTGEGCTTRIYAYDEETNIDSLTTRAPGTGGVCATEGGTAVNHSYDSANRLTDAGIAYDAFGDITKLPAADAGGHELVSTFYADETLATQSQNGQTLGYYLDPEGRDRQIVSTGTVNSTVTYHYAGGGSSPAWTEDTAGKWTRNIYGFEGLVATQNGGESPVLQVQDLKGDVVGTASLSETATGLLSKGDSTEYGVPRTSSPPKYSWQGGSALRTELPSGVIAMGARSYVPQIGRFLQPDPIEGGSANKYAYTYGDPVNSSDPSGEFTVATPSWVRGFFNEQAEIATEAAIQRAAEEQAAREEAEEKAREAAEEAFDALTETYTGGGGGGGGGKKGKDKKGKAAGKTDSYSRSYQCNWAKICYPSQIKVKCNAACKAKSNKEEEKRKKKEKEKEEEDKRIREEDEHDRECGIPIQAGYRPGVDSAGLSGGVYYGSDRVENVVCHEPGPSVEPGDLGAWEQWPGQEPARRPNEQPIGPPRHSIHAVRV